MRGNRVVVDKVMETEELAYRQTLPITTDVEKEEGKVTRTTRRSMLPLMSRRFRDASTTW